MKVQSIGSNQAEVTLADGTCILFSYQVPVAAIVPGKGWIRTAFKHSVTTSKHINAWIRKHRGQYVIDGVQSVPQWDLDQLVAF